MSLINNNAIVLFGAPNNKNLTVSKELSDLGITMLRSAPSDLRITSIPDRNQPKYAFYIGNLAAYMQSWVTGDSVDATKPGFPIEVALSRTLPMFPPNLILGWTTPIDEAKKDEIMRKHNGIPIMSKNGKPGISVQKPNWIEYSSVIDEFMPDSNFPAPQDHFNSGTFVGALTSVRLISTLIALHHYPAWKDENHLTDYLDDYWAEAEMAREEIRAETSTTVEPTTKQISKIKHLLNAKGVAYPYKDVEKAVCYVESHQLANTDGLFFPYFGSLSTFDTKTVPDFINQYLIKSLEEDVNEIVTEMEDLRRAWGVLGTTEWGKMMAHVTKCLSIALNCQSCCVPIFTSQKIYRGCVLQGFGFTVEVNARRFRPVPYADLQKAVRDADLHNLAMAKIADVLPAAVKKKMEEGTYGTIDSSIKLREILITSGIAETDKADVLKYGRWLSFPGERFWPINVQSIERAVDAIVNPEMSLQGFPIHGSQLLTMKREHVVWSCFGPIAPSFLIPGGRNVDLSSSLKISVPQARRGGQVMNVDQILSRLAVRNVVLESALIDLDKVMSDKRVQTPFAMPNVRNSQANKDRYFSGGDCTRIIAGLRKLCRISEVSSTSKRNADAGPSDTRAQKRFKGAF